MNSGFSHKISENENAVAFADAAADICKFIFKNVKMRRYKTVAACDRGKRIGIETFCFYKITCDKKTVAVTNKNFCGIIKNRKHSQIRLNDGIATLICKKTVVKNS